MSVPPRIVPAPVFIATRIAEYSSPGGAKLLETLRSLRWGRTLARRAKRGNPRFNDFVPSSSRGVDGRAPRPSFRQWRRRETQPSRDNRSVRSAKTSSAGREVTSPASKRAIRSRISRSHAFSTAVVTGGSPGRAIVRRKAHDRRWERPAVAELSARRSLGGLRLLDACPHPGGALGFWAVPCQAPPCQTTPRDLVGDSSLRTKSTSRGENRY